MVSGALDSIAWQAVNSELQARKLRDNVTGKLAIEFIVIES